MTAHTVVVDDIKLHYTVTGEGPPLLLLHGYAHTGAMFRRPVESYLARHYTCYALDLPGHGKSARVPLRWYALDSCTALIAHFCTTLKLTSVTLVGYSMGGMLALKLALDQPHLVDRLVCINPPIRGDFLDWLGWLRWFDWLIETPIAEALFGLYKSSRLFSLFADMRRYHNFWEMWPTEQAKQAWAEVKQASVTGLFGSFRIIYRNDLLPALKHLQPPTLVISSLEDDVVPHEHRRLLYETAPTVHLATIAEAGHLPQAERPHAVDALLQTYLNAHTRDVLKSVSTTPST